MKLVIIESPYAGVATLDDREANIAYARQALAHSLRQGEAPFASHALYTQPGVLDDGDRVDRLMGIEAGFAWGARADLVAVYTDRGISAGMQLGIENAKRRGVPIEYRTLVQPFDPA